MSRPGPRFRSLAVAAALFAPLVFSLSTAAPATAAAPKAAAHAVVPQAFARTGTSAGGGGDIGVVTGGGGGATTGRPKGCVGKRCPGGTTGRPVTRPVQPREPRNPRPTRPGGPRPGSGGNPGSAVDRVWRVYDSQFWPQGKEPNNIDAPPVSGDFGGCGANPNDPHRQLSVGVRFSYALQLRISDYTEQTQPGNIIPNSLQYTCQWPPLYNVKPVTCVSHAQADVFGPQDNNDRALTPPYALLHPSQLLDHDDVTTPWARNMSSIPLCNGSYQVGANAHVTVMGRYSAPAAVSQYNCEIYEYTTADPQTGIVPPPVLTNCDGPFIRQTVVRGQLDCTGWKPYWTTGPAPSGKPFMFVPEDCPGAGKLIDCDVKGAPSALSPAVPGRPAQRVNGGRMSVLDDGRKWQVQWPRPNITGYVRVHKTETTLLRDENGTPWRENADPDSQLIRADINVLVPTLRWDYTHQFFKASTPNKPSFHFLRYRVDADWPVQNVQITGINFATDDFVVSNIPGTVRAVGTCFSDKMRMEVYRSRVSSTTQN